MLNFTYGCLYLDNASSKSGFLSLSSYHEISFSISGTVVGETKKIDSLQPFASFLSVFGYKATEFNQTCLARLKSQGEFLQPLLQGFMKTVSI